MKTAGAILAAVVVIGGIWYVSSKDAAPATESVVGSQTETEATLTEGTTVSNPSELAAKGGQFKCTFSMVDPNTTSSGTVYIEGDKVRGDFVSTVKAVNQTVETHTLSDGSYSWTWTGNTNTGFKFPVIKGGYGGGGTSGGMDFSAFGANTSWKCVSAKFEASTFAVPTTVNFIQGAPATK